MNKQYVSCRVLRRFILLVPLGLAAGWLLYLVRRAVHEEWKRRSAGAAFLSAAAGAATAAAVQRGAGLWLR